MPVYQKKMTPESFNWLKNVVNCTWWIRTMFSNEGSRFLSPGNRSQHNITADRTFKIHRTSCQTESLLSTQSRVDVCVCWGMHGWSGSQVGTKDHRWIWPLTYANVCWTTRVLPRTRVCVSACAHICGLYAHACRDCVFVLLPVGAGVRVQDNILF